MIRSPVMQLQVDGNGWPDVHHRLPNAPIGQCGAGGPWSADWGVVSCLACLEKAPDTPSVRARRAEVLELRAKH